MDSTYPKVSNFKSPRSGAPVPNQLIIEHGNRTYFQSYQTIIAYKSPEGVTLDTGALDYSRTTSRYLYEFLSSDRAEVLRRIKSGDYKTADLNA